MTFILFVQAAWAFVKKHALAIGAIVVALVGFLLGFEVKKRPVVVSGQDPVKDQAEKQTQAAVQVAQEQHDVVVQQAEAAAAAQDAVVVKQEQTETAAVETNVDETNAYLKQVSQEIGGDSSNGPTGSTGTKG